MEYTNSRIREIIGEYVHNSKHREMLFDRFIDGMSFERIAEKHDMSVRQTKTIIYKLQVTIFKHLD